MEHTCLLLYQTGETQYGLHLDSVEQVVRAVYITPITGVPSSVCGIVKVRGELLPVIDLRADQNVGFRPVSLTDQLIIVHTRTRRLVLLVEAVLGLYQGEPHVEVGTDALLADSRNLAGAVTTREGFILIQNIEEFFSLAEESQLDQVLATA
jgi:purine-binding chemotaxis protein CheW